MKKQRIEYNSPVDALIAIAKRLSIHEQQHHLSSEVFFEQYSTGLLTDDAVFIEWANDYRHFLNLRKQLAEKLQNAA